VMLCATFMMPNGTLGMFEGVARKFLPWASAGFFMFLGFYGMMRGLREAQVNAIAGIAMTLAYSGSFVGSYSIASNVIAPGLRSRASAGAALEVITHHDGTGKSPEELLEATGLDPEAEGEVAEAAAAEDGFQEVHVSGASEEEDLKSIREMGDARKRNSSRLDELKDKLPELAK